MIFFKKYLLAVCIMLSCQTGFAQLTKGQTAPAVTLTNSKDSLVSLASFKGKVVLLDFWASWCGPCRRSNPKLVKLYDEFKGQAFEIVAVSVDQNKAAWLQAIQQDGLAYTQLIERNNSAKVAEAYEIYQIPTSYLIDKQGRLREKNLDGKDLKNSISKLLKEE